MAEASGTTRPARARKAAPAKAASTKAAATPAAAKTAPTATTNVDRFRVDMEHDGATKSYEKFRAPESMKGVFVGSLYAPLGTQRIAVMVFGPNDQDEASE